MRRSLSRNDPYGVAQRWSTHGNISQRVYTVAYPNAIWHIDRHLSLNHWKLVVHSAIDGYSHLITYLHSTDNSASTVLNLFTLAGQQYGFPSRVRSDHGGENFDVVHFLLLLRGEQRGSHITGRSTHNQRI